MVESMLQEVRHLEGRGEGRGGEGRGGWRGEMKRGEEGIGKEGRGGIRWREGRGDMKGIGMLRIRKGRGEERRKVEGDSNYVCPHHRALTAPVVCRR